MGTIMPTAITSTQPEGDRVAVHLGTADGQVWLDVENVHHGAFFLDDQARQQLVEALGGRLIA